jgi:hypothetical protein
VKKKSTEAAATDSSSTQNAATAEGSAPAATLRHGRHSTSRLAGGGHSRRDIFRNMLSIIVKPKSNSKDILTQDPSLLNVIGGVTEHPLTGENWEMTNDLPDYSLKIYKADQSFKYLLTHAVRKLPFYLESRFS